MFLLSYNTFGEGIFSNAPSLLQNYDRLSFFGECTIDAIHLVEDTLTDNEIKTKDEEPVYAIGTILAANFENTLECGSLILYAGNFPTKYIIRRKADGEQLNKKISEEAVDVVTYTDHTPKNNINYTYTVAPYYDDGAGVIIEGRGLEGDGSVSFSGWILTDTSSTPVTSYLFDIEVESGQFKVNRGFKLFENHTEFPAVRFNKMKYRSGSISTIPLDENLEATDIQLQEIMEFIENGEEKILRSPSGDAFKVVTSNFGYKYNDKTVQHIYTISFDVTQVGTV